MKIRIILFLLLGISVAGVCFAQSDPGSPIGNEDSSASDKVSPPAAPTGLSAKAGNGQVILSWAVSKGATSYTVKRGTASGSYDTTFTTTTGTNYIDTMVTSGTAYYYVVEAENEAGASEDSNEVSALQSFL